MKPITTGSDIVSARNTLDLSQIALAAALGISVATLRKYESTPRLDLMAGLAVECLLRRETEFTSSPEAEAERAFRKAQRLRELKEAHGLTSGYKRLTPAQLLDRKEALAAEKLRRARNRQRDLERPIVQAVHATLRLLAAEAVTTQDWTAYGAALRSACGRNPEASSFLPAYIDAAQARIVADDDPLVTLPHEEAAP